MTEYANGADGACQNCGEPTSEEWHAFCGSCFREEMGWDEPGDEQLEDDLDRVDTVSPVRELCPHCMRSRVLLPAADGERRCIDCRGAYR